MTPAYKIHGRESSIDYEDAVNMNL